MVADTLETLRSHGIQPSAQRVEVARYVLTTDEHPSADRVWEVVRERQPTISRATIYNTLNLFVEQGLLRTLTLSEGHVVFDPMIRRHHHFVDEATGAIVDVPWDALKVTGVDGLAFDVADYQVVLRGRLG